MKIIRLDSAKEGFILDSIKSGKTFVYPTDTVYGLGCNALDENAINKVRGIKNTTKPLSVIAPSKEWITSNFFVKHPEYLEKLPGPYTIIMKMKRQVIPGIVSVNTLGIRIPDHLLTKTIQKSGLPFITTSCNIGGERTIAGISELPKEIKEKVDVIIDCGRLGNKPSQVIDVTGDEPIILRK